PERLAVIARTSAMIYKSARKSVQLIGRELGVSHIVEGTVRRAGDRVRASAKLVDVSSQTQVWAETYDRDLGDILRLQGDLASAIAGAIHLQLTPGTRQRLDRSRSVDPDAYEQYLRGRFLWNQRTQHSIEQAIGCQQNAIAIDPACAADQLQLRDRASLAGVLSVGGGPPAGSGRRHSRVRTPRPAVADHPHQRRHRAVLGARFRHRGRTVPGRASSRAEFLGGAL